uniref:NEP1-interacting protein 1 n=1 Tax=Anthurium amnicola TaxID=1678845 RepID=A0A1D1YY53_9ARAE
MGSGVSRMGPRPPQTAAVAMHRPRLTLARLLCGTSFDDDPPQMEDLLDDSSSTTLESPARVGESSMNDDLQGSAEGSSSTTCSESIISSQSASQSHNEHLDGLTTYSGSRSLETSMSGRHSSESKEVMPSQRNTDFHHEKASFEERAAEQASSSSKPLTSGPLPELGNLPANDTHVGNRADVDPDVNRSGGDTNPPSSIQSATQYLSEDESGEGAAHPDAGLFVPLRSRQRRSGSVLHVDIVTISSNVFSRNSGNVENDEARRNSRRLFWDAFSRRSSERDDGSPSILFSTDDTDDLTSHDRWLLNLSSDFFGNGGEDSEYRSRRSAAERRRHSRSQMWEGLRDGHDERGGRSTLCASGLHPDGTCSCESFLLAEGSGTRGSISRIVMLAEALFEVLDEIHRQPVPLSLSMLSRPAPESIVNSFPLKIHRKSNMAETGDREQCYICLAEYEEGDQIRVLPCRHEYHMPCVDKWLKEIHGVCPLCRGDVCNGVAECPTTNS